MMTFRDYYMRFICVNDLNLTNEWGWFVDIELNDEPTNPIKMPYYMYNNRSIPSTIKEYPRIRSIKSLSNLNDTSMIFELDEDKCINAYNILCTNLIIILMVCIFYSTRI